MIPRPQKDSQGKIKGEFYPLQKAELIALRKSKLINNAAFVHLALRYENPYCDRPIEIFPKQFSKRWFIPESSVYEAIAKLKEAKAIEIKSGRVVIEWATEPQISTINSQQDDDSENPESFCESRISSENPESVLRIQKNLRDPRMDSEIPENHSPEPAPSKDSTSLQTIQTYPDFIRSLSDSERKSFEKFVREEWKRLKGEEVVSMERFLSREEDIKNWYDKFLNSPAGKAAKKQVIANEQDWQTDPRFEEWIWEAFKRGYEWVHESEAEREQRNAFYNWAFEAKAFEVCMQTIYGSEGSEQ